jgi:hypothetical protein
MSMLTSKRYLAAAFLAAACLAAAQTARAETQDPCQDARNHARVERDIAQGFGALSWTLGGIGFSDLGWQYYSRSSAHNLAAQYWTNLAIQLKKDGACP